MDRRPRQISPRAAGFTLVEVMVAIMILLVGVLGTVALVDGASGATQANRAREGGTNLTREVIEDVRALNYGTVVPGTVASQIAARTGGTYNSATQTIAYSRRGFTYTATVDACYVDDPKDEYGSHSGSSFCNSNTGTLDRFALDYKRVTVVVSWKLQGKAAQHSRQTAILNDPGSSFAPQITDLHMTSPTTCDGDPACAQIDVATNASASFSVTTSIPAGTVTWYVDGTKKGTASGSGTGPWTFTWPLAGVPNGTYLVQVIANSGKDGPVRSLTIPVKAAAIGSPTNFKGGFNQLFPTTAELTWTAYPAAVLGYHVYRMTGATRSAAPISCADAKGANATVLPTSPYCMDTAAASTTTGYELHTVYSVGVTQTESATPTTLTLNASNKRPCVVTALTRTSGNNGTPPVIQWTAPTSATATCDVADIQFYRVYRYGPDPNGTGHAVALSERTFATSGADVITYTDTSVTSQANKYHYWVTAVDDENAESVLAGPDLP